MKFTSEHQAARETPKIDHFGLIVTDKVVFGAIYLTCVISTMTIIHLGVVESGGYLPPAR